MRQGILTRLIIFGIATLAAVIYLLPTFLPGLPDWWSSFLPIDKIHLGLDLQGGSHLVLEVKVDKAIENNVERIRGDLVNVLREKGVSGVSVERVEGAQIQVKAPAASADRARGILKSDFGHLVEAKTPQTSGGVTTYYLTLSKEELRSLRDYAVEDHAGVGKREQRQHAVGGPDVQPVLEPGRLGKREHEGPLGKAGASHFCESEAGLLRARRRGNKCPACNFRFSLPAALLLDHSGEMHR